MFVQNIGVQGVTPHASTVGLSDPMRIVDAITRLRDAGAALGYSFETSTNFIHMAEMRRALRNSEVSPMFDPHVNRYLGDRGFWMKALAADGRPIAIQGFRLDDADPNLAEWALGWMMGLYAKRRELIVPEAIHVPDHSVTALIRGPIGYHGELWIDPQNKGIFEIFTRLGMLLALIKWHPEALWSLGSRAMATRGHMVRSGYVHLERSFLRWTWEPDGAEPVEWVGVAERRHLEFMVAEMTPREGKYLPSSVL